MSRMTKEEAIDKLQDLWNEVYNEDSDGYIYAEALDMAIEALSANPSRDLISRQWLLDLYGNYIGDNGEPKYHVPLEVVRQNIKDAPSAEAAHGEWVIRENGNKECSFCKHERQDGWDYFCGYCGARMKSR